MSGGPGAGRWHAKLRREGRSETGQRGGKREKGRICIDVWVCVCTDVERRERERERERETDVS